MSFLTRAMCESQNLTWITGPANATNIRYWEVKNEYWSVEVTYPDPNTGLPITETEWEVVPHLRRYRVLERDENYNCICNQHPPRPRKDNRHNKETAATSSLLPESDPYVFKIPALPVLRKRRSNLKASSGKKRKHSEVDENEEAEEPKCAHLEKQSKAETNQSQLQSATSANDGNVSETLVEDDECLQLIDNDLYNELDSMFDL
ncbi:Hypothetical predicted protein [Cloeon dipterum]|uniref:Uncharacterized protein n=1 Tax=Cloeon dipterum TaxID=197152 RepID=A0A8S1BW86_9INSE|nr:Hypothetical predicted protein [Cloeon dipterum]